MDSLSRVTALSRIIRDSVLTLESIWDALCILPRVVASSLALLISATETLTAASSGIKFSAILPSSKITLKYFVVTVLLVLMGV